MQNENQGFERAGVPVCSACGVRPGAVSAMVATPSGPTNVTLCQRCARQLMQTGSLDQGAAPNGAPARAQEPENQSKTPALDEFGRDLTADAEAGRIDPVIGRAEEIEQTVEILARRRKNNAVLIGEAGVGKTAIVEGLARRVAEGDVPA